MSTAPTYIVLGAGRQGTAAAYDLIANCEAGAVLLVDPNKPQLAASTARLRKLLGKRASALYSASQASDRDLAAATVVLGCTPYRFNVDLTRRCLAAGVHFCDLGGNPDIVAQQEQLAKPPSKASAKSKSSSTASPLPAIVPDCGVSPGLSNILAVHAATAHGADEVRVRCGGLPLVPPDPAKNPLLYKLVFSAYGLISEYSGEVPLLKDGRLATIEALSTIEPFTLPATDATGAYAPLHLESSPTSNNSPQVVRHLARSGVRDYDYQTLRYPGHWGKAQGWKTVGYLRQDSTLDAELATRLESDPALRYDPRRDRDRLILVVNGTRHSGAAIAQRWEYRLDLAADPKTGFTAMELTTSWGITIVAHHIASGRGAPQGFATPERFVDTTWVLAELDRRVTALGQ